MAAIAVGCIVAALVTIAAVLVQMSAGLRLDLILPRSVGVGCAVGLAAGIWWAW